MADEQHDNQPNFGKSILDRVLESQQTDTLEHYDPLETLSEVLKHVSQKEADVIRRRFGLGKERTETLEEIGASYHVTRERVRQIERWGIDRLRKSAVVQTILRRIEVLIEELLESNGNVLLEEDLYRQLHSHSTDTAATRAATRFILEELLTGKIVRVSDARHKPYWKLPFMNAELMDVTIQDLEVMFRELNHPLMRDEILQRFKERPFYQEHRAVITDDIITSFMHIAKSIEQNPFGELGLRNWGSIVPRRMNDKILMVLRKQEQPMHFHDITQRINEIGFDDRQAYPPTVHNELILNKEYVLVGRGIYALREWGYKPGVVADVLADILAKSDQPLTRDELVKKVLEQRQVKKNTIHLALTDKTRFTRQADGRYALVQTNTKTETPA